MYLQYFKKYDIEILQLFCERGIDLNHIDKNG